jgi:uncharacterized membrane protein YtjA (UPF0391 family)
VTDVIQRWTGLDERAYTSGLIFFIVSRCAMQLPFENSSWAKGVAKIVIVATVLLEVAVVFWLRQYGPLDIPEILALILFAIAVIPPSVHIIRGKSYYARAVHE